MEDFNIGSMKVRNIMTQFGVIDQESEEIAKAHQVGDVHPNGKWVWTEYRPGHFDWRPMKGRGSGDGSPKKDDEGGSKKTDVSSKTSGADVSKFMDAIKVYSNKYTDESKVTVSKTPKGNWNVSYDGHRLGIIGGNMLSDKVAKEKGWIEGSQKKAPTLENAAKSPKAPGSVKAAAEAELKERKNKGIAKKLNLYSKGELAKELTRIASEWDSYDDAQKTKTKQAIAQAHSTVLENIISGNASDEAIAALKDLTSIQNFFKEAASQPKQVGDLKAKKMNELFPDAKESKGEEVSEDKKQKALEYIQQMVYSPAGEFDDLSKVSLRKTPNGDWDIFYGKKNIMTYRGSALDDETARNSGLWKESDVQEVKKEQTSSEYDAQKLEHLSEDELLESAKKFGVWARVNRHGEISLEIPSKKEVKNLKKFLSDNGINFDETKLIKEPSFYGTHNYSYDLYSGKQENSIGYYERKAGYIQNDIDYLTNSSKNHPDERQRAAAKKELENGSLKRELDEVNEKIASLKKTLK